MLVVGGLCGALLGGNIADILGRYVRGSRILIAALGCGVGLPCYLVTLLTHSLPLFIVFGTLAIFAFSTWIGPLTAAIQDATPPALRGTAVAVTLLLAHLGGDVWAPTLVGVISTNMLHERVGLALLIVGIPALLLAIVVAYFGAPLHAADVASRNHD
jgi:MFS family permease